MTILDEIIEAHPEETFLTADGLEDAVIGVDYNTMRLVYSVAKCIEITSKDMSVDDAIEYLEFNTFNAYVGEKTPIWVHDDF